MNVVVALAVAAGVFVAAQLVLARARAARLGRRVDAHVHVRPRLHEQPAAEGRARAALDRVERSLEGRAWWTAAVARLARAGIERRPVDVLALVAALAVAAVPPGAALGGAVGALAVLAAVPALAWLALGSLAQRRIKAFDEQLPDLLAALSSSLRAGHGFLQSLQAVAADAPSPTGPELRRALSETRLGRPLDEALAGIAARVPSQDFSYVLTAVAVQRQAGGSLAGLFETVNDTVRERQKFVRKVRALTATGRSSAYSLIALPFAVAALLSLINRAYLAPLLETPAGRAMLVGGLASLALGSVLVRRIVSFKG